MIERNFARQGENQDDFVNINKDTGSDGMRSRRSEHRGYTKFSDNSVDYRHRGNRNDVLRRMHADHMMKRGEIDSWMIADKRCDYCLKHLFKNRTKNVEWCSNPVCRGKLQQRIECILGEDGLDFPHMTPSLLSHITNSISKENDPMMILEHDDSLFKMCLPYFRKCGWKALDMRNHLINMIFSKGRYSDNKKYDKFLEVSGFTEFFGEDVSNGLRKMFPSSFHLFKILMTSDHSRSNRSSIYTRDEVKKYILYFEEIFGYCDGTYDKSIMSYNKGKFKNLEVYMFDNIQNKDIIEKYIQMNGGFVKTNSFNYIPGYMDLIICNDIGKLSNKDGLIAFEPDEFLRSFC